MESICINVKDITKDYGNHKGIFNVSFEIKKGEIFGFLGPNGAGKTTTIRHILGFSKTDSGEAIIDGINTWEHPANMDGKIGFLPGEIAFPDNMTGTEYIKFIGDLQGLTNYDRADELIKMFGIDTSGKIKKMSKGMKQKVGIVTAFMNQPPILILDEPTSGLDPLMQKQFIELVKQEKKRGATILLSSHMFQEVERTCDRVAIIRNGIIVSELNINDIKHNENKRYKIEFIKSTDYDKFILEDLNISCKEADKKHVVVNVKDEDVNEFFHVLNKYEIKYFSEIKNSLEDYFMSFYGEDKQNDK
jgi:ABC-2 type transport system ATP-binding protein